MSDNPERDTLHGSLKELHDALADLITTIGEEFARACPTFAKVLRRVLRKAKE